MTTTKGIVLLLIANAALVPASHAGSKKLGNALKFGRTEEDLIADCSSGKGGLQDCGEPLMFTPDQLTTPEGTAAARAAARRSIGNITSFSGFFETDAAVENNLFWWYFPPQNGNENAPTLVWLQGGPGGASTFGLFAEMGPFALTPDATDPTGFKLVDRPTSWNKDYGMIFIDNPVGAGFSFTGTGNGYCTNTHDCVARNLYSALQQFYKMFDKLQGNQLWITGESYGGHYVPAIGAYIHDQNEAIARGLNRSNVALPLAGIAVGDGWVDPINMLDAYAPMIYNQGMCSLLEAQTIKQYTDETITAIKQGDYLGAFNVWDRFLNGDIFPYANYFHNITGLNDYDNYMNTDPPVDLEYYAKYLNNPSVRKALNVGAHTMQSGHECEMHLLTDFMASLAKEIVTLMSHPEKYRVLVYSGQLDVIIGAALTESFLAVLDWPQADAFNKSFKKVWRIAPTDTDVAGYAREVGNFSQVIIRGAGHLCPHDQPERALNMIQHLVENIPYKHEPNPQS